MERQRGHLFQETETPESRPSFPPLDPVENRRDMVTHFDSYLIREENPDGTIGPLTPRQSVSIHKIRDFFASSERLGRLDHACGFGKTALQLCTADAIGAGKRQPNGSRRQVVLNTSRISITEQLTLANIQRGGTVMSEAAYFTPNLSTSVYRAGQHDMSGDIVVMPYQSLHLAVERGDIIPGFSPTYLLDEDHNIGHKRMRLLNQIGHSAVLLGFGATPGAAVNMLPNQIDQVSMLEGITKYGFLCDMRLHGIATGKSVRKLPKNQDYLAGDLYRFARDPERNQQAIDTAIFATKRFGKGMIRCHPESHGFRHTEHLAKLINQAGHTVVRNGIERDLRVEVVSGRSKRSKQILEEFISTDAIDILLHVKYANEGVNIPALAWILWMPPTCSYDELEQGTGRGGRKDPHNPHKLSRFYQLVDSDISGQNAFAWELFGVPRTVYESQVTHEGGVEYIRSGPRTRANPQLPGIIDDEAYADERAHTLAFTSEAVDHTVKRNLVSIETLEAIAGIDPTWLRRILFHAGYTMQVDTGRESPLCYDESAETFVDEHIAKEGDIPLEEFGEKIEKSVYLVRKLLQEHGLSSGKLYRRQPGASIPRMKIFHIRKADAEQLLLSKEVQAQVLMPLHEAVHDAGLNITGRALYHYFDDRGFTITTQTSAVYGRATYLGSKVALTSWAEAYKNAQPKPDNYCPLNAYSKYVYYIDGNKLRATRKEVYAAIRNTAIPVKIFVDGDIRKDCIHHEHRQTLQTSLLQILNERDTSPAKPQPPHTPHEDSSAIPKELSDRMSKIAQDYGQPPALLYTILHNHKALKDHSKMDAENIIGHLHTILDRHSRAIPQIPASWISSLSLAKELEVSHDALLRFTKAREIDTSHIKYISISGMPGVFAFCSTPLATMLRATKAKNQTQSTTD